MKAEGTSRWGNSTPNPKPITNDECHTLFIAHVREVAGVKMPYLFPLLDACSASFYAEPGVFLFALPAAPAAWFDVPDLALLISTVPWIHHDTKSH